jgi:hypothetical protein
MCEEGPGGAVAVAQFVVKDVIAGAALAKLDGGDHVLLEAPCSVAPLDRSVTSILVPQKNARGRGANFPI